MLCTFYGFLLLICYVYSSLLVLSADIMEELLFALHILWFLVANLLCFLLLICYVYSSLLVLSADIMEELLFALHILWFLVANLLCI